MELGLDPDPVNLELNPDLGAWIGDPAHHCKEWSPESLESFKMNLNLKPQNSSFSKPLTTLWRDIFVQRNVWSPERLESCEMNLNLKHQNSSFSKPLTTFLA